MNRILTIAFLLQSTAGIGQQPKVVDVNKETINVSPMRFYTVGGEPVSNVKYVRVVSGTPYFKEAWMKGSLDLSDGRGYENLWLKLDLMDNSLLYVDTDGKEMVATSVIKNVTLIDSVTGNKFDFIHSSFIGATERIDPGWYQVIATGKATVYKRFVKIINEFKPYGSATYEQSIVTGSRYYLFSDSVFTEIKKIRSVPDMLQNKKKELTEFINTKRLTGKSDTDYQELVMYYNSLRAK